MEWPYRRGFVEMMPFDAALQDGFRGEGRVCDTHVETKGTGTKEKKGDQFRCVVRVHVRCTRIILMPAIKCQGVRGNTIDTTSISAVPPPRPRRTMPALPIRPCPKKPNSKIHAPRPASPVNKTISPAATFFPVSFSHLPTA